jgi:hypothetical protein
MSKINGVFNLAFEGSQLTNEIISLLSLVGNFLGFGVFAIGFFLILGLLSESNKFEEVCRWGVFGSCVFSLFSVFGQFQINPTLEFSLEALASAELIIIATLGGGIGFIVFYVTSLVWDSIKSILTKNNFSNRDAKTDIRTVEQFLPKLTVKPCTKHYKKGSHFLGYDRYSKPIFVDRHVYVSTHKQFIGTTGCGKGKQIQSHVYQDVLNGDTPVVFNPKPDEKQRMLISLTAKKFNCKVVYIELLGSRPQLNIFKNKNIQQIEELLEVAFNLSEQGTDADFYRLNDRKANKLFSKFIYKRKDRFSTNVTEFLKEFEFELKEAEKYKNDLMELSSLIAIDSGDKGLSIESILDEQSILYIGGSMRYNLAVKAQKLLLLSVMQACESRNMKNANYVGVYLDEFKYLISRSAMEALGALRDKKAHVTLAHQSLGDLRDCGAGLSEESVISSVNENCGLKLAFKVHDPDTADWLARMTGTILVDDEQRKFSTNKAFVEVSEHERTLRQSERALIDSNMFMSLPRGCGVVIGDGLSKFVSTVPIKLDENLAVMLPTEVEDDEYFYTQERKTNRDLIDVG